MILCFRSRSLLSLLKADTVIPASRAGCTAWRNRTGPSAQMMRGHCVFWGLLPNFIPWDFVLEAPFRNLSPDFQGRIEPPRPSCVAQPSLLNVFPNLCVKRGKMAHMLSKVKNFLCFCQSALVTMSKSNQIFYKSSDWQKVKIPH